MEILGCNVGEARARPEDPETSHEAARVVRGEKATKLEALVIHALRRLGGDGTSEEVARILGIDLQSISPRFRPLAERGLILDSGKRRPGVSGRQRIVWEIVP